MKFLQHILHEQKKNFLPGGKLEKFYYAFEAIETLMFVPDSTTASRGVQVRDAIDLKRMMMTVIIAMIPCLLFGMWNVGHQHALATGAAMEFMDKMIFGAIQVLPIVIVSYVVGLGIEFGFAIMRKHPVNEGFLVTGMLIPLCLPATIPLWMVAIATAFSVVIGKEVFGGTGMNVLNPALTARAFLFFAYPAYMAGEIWTVLGDQKANLVNGYSGATALSIAYETSSSGQGEVVAAMNNSWSDGLFSFWNLFMGAVPGSIGETSTLMCLIGAVILIVTGVGSARIIVSVFAGGYLTGLLLNALAVNAFMALPAHYHLVMGGFAFGAVFMATDPVSGSQTNSGKWIYGFLIGAMCVLIRVFNPAYPEGMMLAILLMNVLAPLIDFYVVDANKKRRLKRATV
jgi:Na+-transporting NADH:ubiquinone oxidoreductase subunit B